MSDADLRRFREDTSPSGHDVRNLKARLAASQHEEAGFDDLLRQLPGPDAAAELRVRARVHQSLRAPRRRPAWVAPLIGASGSAVLTLALLMLWTRPAPLQADTVADAVLPTGLTLSADGQGAVAGTVVAPRIEWRRGTLSVDVDPAAGLQVTVETPEAEVAVLGTAFTVTRGALGTTVDVARGKVAVRCVEVEEGVVLTAEQSNTCAPTTPAGLLARARALQGQRRLESAVQAADAGLGRAPKDAVRTELRLVRVEALAAQNKRDAALAGVRELLADGPGHRRTDALHLAVDTAGPRASCSTVRPWLEELADQGGRADELGRLADCVAKSDPKRARGLLERALSLDPDADETRAIRRRLRRLK